jgi:hypothetical protein
MLFKKQIVEKVGFKVPTQRFPGLQPEITSSHFKYWLWNHNCLVEGAAVLVWVIFTQWYVQWVDKSLRACRLAPFFQGNATQLNQL